AATKAAATKIQAFRRGHTAAAAAEAIIKAAAAAEAAAQAAADPISFVTPPSSPKKALQRRRQAPWSPGDNHILYISSGENTINNPSEAPGAHLQTDRTPPRSKTPKPSKIKSKKFPSQLWQRRDPGEEWRSRFAAEDAVPNRHLMPIEGSLGTSSLTPGKAAGSSNDSNISNTSLSGENTINSQRRSSQQLFNDKVGGYTKKKSRKRRRRKRRSKKRKKKRKKKGSLKRKKRRRRRSR
ncbi:hypothetical protein OAI84_00005, partial [bacterium]|nr:hypothetical protein [bacterium]